MSSFGRPTLLRLRRGVVLNSTYEGLPHVVLEAIAAGIPVIATDAGGTGEVVEHQVTGLLVRVGDSAGLRAAIEELCGFLAPALRAAKSNT